MEVFLFAVDHIDTGAGIVNDDNEDNDVLLAGC
jgi:hypothetical protein